MLGLPDDARACLFDLDGVLTDTASVHAAAWKDAFDEFLRGWADRKQVPFVPFEIQGDYQRYVDGRPRSDGVRTFLASRGITLPDGNPDDPPTAPTVWGLGNRKNEIFHRRLHEDGVHVFEGSRRYVDAVRAAGLARAVVSSSANTAEVLAVAGLADRFDVRIDGVVIEQDHLPGKPAPDTYLAAAKALGVPASAGVVFEDALAGVEAGRRGNFGFVVGVDRVGDADGLRRAGADVVVSDLAQLLESP